MVLQPLVFDGSLHLVCGIVRTNHPVTWGVLGGRLQRRRIDRWPVNKCRQRLSHFDNVGGEHLASVGANMPRHYELCRAA